MVRTVTIFQSLLVNRIMLVVIEHAITKILISGELIRDFRKDDTMTVWELLDNAVSELEQNDFNYANEQAKLLLAHVLDKDTKELKDLFSDKISKERYMEYQELLNKCIAERMPVQYLIGYTVFNNMKFKVNKTSMLPDPVTELLINVVIEYMGDRESLKLIDLGTGVGVIAISLAKELVGAEVHAVDISPEAIEITKKNCILNRVGDNIFFHENDLLKKFEDIIPVNKIDAIVSNPPYVKSANIEKLPFQVKKFSPIIALDGKKDGLHFYKEIMRQAIPYLKNEGYIFFEYEKAIADDLLNLINANSSYNLVDTRKNNLDWGWVAIIQKKI